MKNYINDINAQFNKELQTLTAENADTVVLMLGNPSKILLSTGIENKPLKLYGNKLISKAKKHGFNILDLKNLPRAVANPIAIFKGNITNSFAVLTKLYIGEHNVLATLSIGKGMDIDFNIISSVYRKSVISIVSWVNKGKLLYVNKEKTLDYLRIPAPIAGAQNNPKLNDATKLIKIFENPKFCKKIFLTNPSIKYWQTDERPREKLMKHGATTLSNAELLAIIINNGNREHSALDLAKQILATCNNDFLELSKKDVSQLAKQFKGIGPAKAVTLVATLEIARRRYEAKASMRPKITDSRSAFEVFFKDLCDLNHEEFWTLYVNASGQLITKQRICEGGISQTSVDVKKIMQTAITNRAVGLILGHNHPSGHITPSNNDILLTQKIQTAAKFLDLRVMDHIILSGNDYYSFGDDGIL